MKNIIQLAIIVAICVAGNIIQETFNVPIPGNIIGMLLLLTLLLTNTLKLSMIEDISNFMLKHLSFFFIPAAVGLITCFSILDGKWFTLMFISLVSTIIIVVVTGLTVQILMKKRQINE